MNPHNMSRVAIEQRMDAPAENVIPYVLDFRNAKEWMVGIESVQKLDGNSYRLQLETPVGRIKPEASITEPGERRIRWVYTSVIDGFGEVGISPAGDGSCIVSYTGEFSLRNRLLDRAAQLAGVERFAARNGERSLLRLKHLMEARRY